MTLSVERTLEGLTGEMPSEGMNEASGSAVTEILEESVDEGTGEEITSLLKEALDKCIGVGTGVILPMKGKLEGVGDGTDEAEAACAEEILEACTTEGTYEEDTLLVEETCIWEGRDEEVVTFLELETFEDDIAKGTREMVISLPETLEERAGKRVENEMTSLVEETCKKGVRVGIDDGRVAAMDVSIIELPSQTTGEEESKDESVAVQRSNVSSIGDWTGCRKDCEQ